MKNATKCIVAAVSTAAMGVAMTVPAHAYTYIKYDILTSGSGLQTSRSGSVFLNNVGFSFAIPIDGPYRFDSGPQSISFTSFIDRLGYLPGEATAKWSADRMILGDTSSDHAFTASVCAPSGISFTGFTTASFGIRGCDATVALSLQDYRGGGTSYSGKIVEFRSYLIEAGSQPLGYLGIGAVPEPATWAMMLVGFAMVGGAARYRRRSAKITYA